MRIVPSVAITLMCLSLAELLWVWYPLLVFCALGPVCLVLGTHWPASGWHLLMLSVVTAASVLSFLDLWRNHGRLTRSLKTWLFPIALLGLSAWLGMWLVLLPVLSVPLWGFVVGAAVLLVVGVFEASHRRAAQAADLARWLRNIIKDDRRETESENEVVIHVIAHSFGTLLTGAMLEHQATKPNAAMALKLARVVLVGSVLQTRFPWARLGRHLTQLLVRPSSQ